MQESRPWRVRSHMTVWDWSPCCCWSCFKHPESTTLLPSTQDNVVTVRRISRVQSTESLDDVGVGASSSPILYTPGCGWQTRPTELPITKEPKALPRSECDLPTKPSLEPPPTSSAPSDEGSQPPSSLETSSSAASLLNCVNAPLLRSRPPPPPLQPSQSFASNAVPPQVYQRTIFPSLNNPPPPPPTPPTPTSSPIGWIENLFETVRRASLSSVGSSAATAEDSETSRSVTMMHLHEDDDSSDNDCGGYKHDDFLTNSNLVEDPEPNHKVVGNQKRLPQELAFKAASLVATVSSLAECSINDDHQQGLLYGEKRNYSGDERNHDGRKVKEEFGGKGRLPSKEGDQDNPARECFGALALSLVRLQNSKVLMVALGQLTGLPWVGGVGVMLLQVCVVPTGNSQWISLPRAYGPQVHINMEVQLRLPRDIVPESCVRVTVWTKDRSWRYCALGHAIAPISNVTETPQPIKANLEAHTQIEQNHGLLEVGLQCLPKTSEVVEDKKPQRKITTHSLHMSAVNTKNRFSKQMKNLRHAHKGHDKANVGEEVILVVDVLRSKDLRFKFRTLLSKVAPTKLRLSSSARDRMEMLCYITAWVRGERVHRRATPPVTLPVTRDPVFRARVHLTIPKNQLQDTAIVIKVCARSSWGQEVVVGRVVMGPLLYLGSSEVPDPPIRLSHWGRALQSRSPVNMWHYLQL
ncbi:uncharacterized protein LOC143036682 [Oratosquilla oratoria]|uniref:uncharacterized protein LOC143036682 n=1 Tax=Oratosquilla oratoria TaxID=337810 RepID=UPI003F7760DC